MKMAGGPASVNLKLFLVIIAILIALGTWYYTHNLVQKIEIRERQIVELYANGLEYIANSNVSETDFTFVFENIVKKIDFPLILTDEYDKVDIYGTSGGIKNIKIDSTFSEQEAKAFINNKIEELKIAHTPITLAFKDSIIFGKIYYGESDLIQRLRFYPYLQIFFAFVFIIIAYISFSYIKKTEQSNIWVGMAKETAHQLGTPISSLMGWAEILKMNYKDPDKVVDVAEEMESDLTRLNKITQRFSKIGSKPELKNVNMFELINKVIEYFQRRLPQSRRDVLLTLQGNKAAIAPINPELFEWVIENLIKNALDAVDSENGKIEINIVETSNYVDVEVTDNGKGIDIKRRKDVFRPGYSTKKRGWGLGLSLSKRIIEDYHKGKIYVKNSVIGEGTTFKLFINKSK